MSIRFFSQVFSPNTDKRGDSTLRITLNRTFGRGEMAEKETPIKDTRLAIYYRVSTNKKAKRTDSNGVVTYESVQTIASQKTMVHEYLLGLGMTQEQIDKIPVYQDHASGKKQTIRPDFQRLHAHILAKKYDNVICYRLDRLARDAQSALKFIFDLDNSKVGFVPVDQPHLNLGTDVPMRLVILAAMAEIAQLERETIVRRIKAGLAAAKKRGVKLGKKKQISKETDNMILQWYFVRKVSAAQIARTFGIGKTYCQELVKKKENVALYSDNVQLLKSLSEKTTTKT